MNVQAATGTMHGIYSYHRILRLWLVEHVVNPAAKNNVGFKDRS